MEASRKVFHSCDSKRIKARWYEVLHQSNGRYVFFINYKFISVYTYVLHLTCATVCTWRLEEDSLLESILSFYRVGSGEPTQVTRLGGRYSLTYWAILPAQEVSFKMLVHKSQAIWRLEVESVKERCEESLGGWVKVPGREEPEKAVWTVVKEIRASERGQQRWRQLRGTEREGSQGRHGDDPSQTYKPSFKVIKM